MSNEIEVIKIYQNDHKKRKYSIQGVSPIIKYKKIKDGYMAYLKLNKNKIIESAFKIDKAAAKESCFKHVLEYLNALDIELNNNKNKTSFKLLLFYFFLALLMVIHIKYNIDNILSLITIPLVAIFFISPWFMIAYDIGICTGNRVIVRWTSIVENVYHKRVYYLNQGDLFLIKSKAEPNNNPDYFEAVISKQVVLTSINKNRAYPTYILPEQISCGISISNTNGDISYYIDLMSYEIDGKPKRYHNLNVPETSFFRADQVPKYHIFSKFGDQVIKERFIGRAKNNFLNWYVSVLSIYISFIATKFNDLYKMSYEDEDRRVGFDNFQPPSKIAQFSN